MSSGLRSNPGAHRHVLDPNSGESDHGGVDWLQSHATPAAANGGQLLGCQRVFSARPVLGSEDPTDSDQGVYS